MSNELGTQELLPPEIGLTLLGFEKSEQGWLVRAEGRTRSECPSCRTQSTSPQSLLEATARSSGSGQAGGAAIAIESMAMSQPGM